MRRRLRRWRRAGGAPGVFAAACYLVAVGCLVAAGWLAFDYANDDEPATSETRYTPTTPAPTVPPPSYVPAAPAAVEGDADEEIVATPPTVDSDRNGNRKPTISGPSELGIGVGSTVTPSGLVVDDVEARDGGSLLLLLVGVGVEFDLDLVGEAQYTGPTAPQWVPMVGTIQDLNRTLATLAITRTEDEAGILLYVDDVGNGDVDRSEKVEFKIEVVDR